MTPSPDDMGTAAMRAPCSWTQRSPSVTVRESEVAQTEARRLEQSGLEGLEVARQRR